MWILLLGCTSPATPGETGDTGDASTSEPPWPPPVPAALTRWVVGDEADVQLSQDAPAVLVAGGGADVDEAMRAWLRGAAGGDVVVLRTSGEDGYNDYLHTELGVQMDSVETLRVDSRALADDPYVAWRIDSAEAVFIAGGDQWTYVDNWTGTATQRALGEVLSRGAMLGGTSAGAAVLGEHVFSAQNGTVTSAEALADPYDPRVQLSPELVGVPALQGVVTDSHFYERDRFGRLLTFVSRAMADGAQAPRVGLGVDEGTALLVDAQGLGTVYGAGFVYVVRADSPATTCEAGAPLSTPAWEVVIVGPGLTVTLPDGPSDGIHGTVAVHDGALTPADPY